MPGAQRLTVEKPDGSLGEGDQAPGSSVCPACCCHCPLGRVSAVSHPESSWGGGVLVVEMEVSGRVSGCVLTGT